MRAKPCHDSSIFRDATDYAGSRNRAGQEVWSKNSRNAGGWTEEREGFDAIVTIFRPRAAPYDRARISS